ncbi:MAG: RNA polymerase sigma factor, partial [Bacteroidota bacterium]
LEELHEASYAWALRCCYEDREAAAEVLQNTYLKILEGNAKFKGDSSFKTWLFSIIRFTAIDYFRAKKRKRNIAFDQQHEAILEVDQIGGENVAASIAFRTLLKQLSPKQQQVLHLVFYQNCTIQEAAEIMQIQLGTARTHYERGKQQLKKQLLKYEAFR